MARSETARLISGFRPGERVFMIGSTGAVLPFLDAFASGDLPPLHLTSSLVPGVNDLPAALPDESRLTNAFPVPGLPASRAMPLSYGGYLSWLASQTFDTCIVQVAPPARGRVASLGCAAEFAPVGMTRSRRILAVVNPAVPHVPDAATLDLDQAEAVFDIDHPLPEYLPGAPDAQARAIAGHIAAFITDGAALQVGLGRVPDALLMALTDRRGLRMQSGMISDSVRALHEADALDPDWMHMSCVHVGSSAHYDWMRKRSGFAVLGCDVTHDPGRLYRSDGLVAVNGALEVDLFGQANLEHAGTRRVSSVGGAADFSRAASLDPRGISVVGLPSDLRKGTVSRIVPRLSVPASLPRHDIDVVVTEHGSADLRGLGPEERADRLIAIAAPDHRPALAAAWEEMARA
ncbi:acetyl-CoA hydrolase/transferase family protein [Seohaeicola zhoushanensis]|uniref:Acetyl-CoA hydrolase/transferase C-terminal domain-containing protein n=1 Tax=Seohaeicola zhoushanensis TaxID=1569283 RepID=A0A8J3H210_9RHOB|nr:acetyl-CoA hydrolase/transferase C-terminal domain-containing protein [Seohaeicola zhoushanensis]GHF67184.1 hypothetical protein GCM10017056_43030 [Seohaeicola zhoushanensis]